MGTSCSLAIPAAVPTPSSLVDLLGRRPARHLAAELAVLTGQRGAVIVLVHPSIGCEVVGHVDDGPAPIDGDALLGLVLPSDPTVCDAARLHEPSLRRLAQHWHTDRVLVGPCTFGNDLVAVAVAPVPNGTSARPVERAARQLTERFAAAVIGNRLLTNFAAHS